MSWLRSGWRSKESPFIPVYPDPIALRQAEDQLKVFPPLVFAGEVVQLKSELARVAEGKAFLLQGGDCAETFADFDTFNIRDTFRVLMQMSLIMAYVGEKPVVRIGRVAGQFAKPRSNPTEVVEGIEIPTYKGDMINSPEPTAAARTPDPTRMIRAYFQSAATLNLLRAFAGGGYADPHRAGQWLLDFMDHSAVREKYMAIVRQIDKSLAGMRALAGADAVVPARKVDFYCSHEALFLPYEEAMCRIDSISGKPVATSGHFLWLGERTRDPDGPHVQLLSGVMNPVGIKCGSKVDVSGLEKILERINPENEQGKIVLILRAGIKNAPRVYSRLIRDIKTAGHSVVWCIDPMHGNPQKGAQGVKTRYFSEIVEECRIFVDVCRAERVHPGGAHLEMTGRNVTECLGGTDRVEDLTENYATGCDPRLNASQALELAFALAEHMAMGRDKDTAIGKVYSGRLSAIL